MAHYIDYYNSQIGSGGSAFNTGINRVYIGTPHQRGSGIGSFLGGLFRSILPLFTRGAKAVGKEAWRTGINVLSDVALNNKPVKESLRTHARESVGNLKRKAEDYLYKYLREGSGYKLKLSPLKINIYLDLTFSTQGSYFPGVGSFLSEKVSTYSLDHIFTPRRLIWSLKVQFSRKLNILVT